MTILMTGNRVVLRDFQHHDLDAFAHWQQLGHTWQEYDGPYYPYEPLAPAYIQQMKKWVDDSNWPHPRRKVVIADRETDSLLGVVTWYWMSEETNWPALGIVIYDPANWGQGIGYEALGLWSDYLFGVELDFARLDLRTWSGNRGMMRLAEKVGYKQEACFRKARIVKGEFYDGMGYGILREEWEALYPDGFAASLSE